MCIYEVNHHCAIALTDKVFRPTGSGIVGVGPYANAQTGMCLSEPGGMPCHFWQDTAPTSMEGLLPEVQRALLAVSNPGFVQDVVERITQEIR